MLEKSGIMLFGVTPENGLLCSKLCFTAGIMLVIMPGERDDPTLALLCRKIGQLCQRNSRFPNHSIMLEIMPA